MLSQMENRNGDSGGFPETYEFLKNLSSWGIRPAEGFGQEDIQLIKQINGISSDIPVFTYAEYIRQVLQKYGDSTAIYSEKGNLSYRGFFSHAYNAAEVISRYVPERTAVAVLVEKSVELFISANAIVLSNRIYAPLDNELPTETAVECIRAMNASAVIADKEWSKRLKDKYQLKVLEVDELMSDNAKEADFREMSSSPDDIFCIIHTSGSTGRPKGVGIRQYGLMSCLSYTNEIFGTTNDDCTLAITNHCHDMSLYDIFGIFIKGGSVAIPYGVSWRDPEVWAKTCEMAGVTIWNSVPSFMEVFLRAEGRRAEKIVGKLKVIIHGGDYFKLSCAERLMRLNPECRIFNCGGPTETTLWNIYHRLTPEDIERGIIPYGRPFPKTEYFILNENMQILPSECYGTMWVSGAGTASGYIGDIDKEKFVFSADGRVLYNTGDQGCYSKEGYIIFKGRNDDQIKRNGKRIELNGIKNTVLNFAGITNVVVLADGEDNRDLYLFYTTDGNIEPPGVKKLLKQHLPQYMIPNIIKKVDHIPLTNNGKPDKKALLLNKSEENTVNIVAEICRNCLGCEREIKGDDNFFLLGGNSATAIKFISELRKRFDCDISIHHIFIYPTIADMANFVMASAKKYTSNMDVENSENFELTFVQKLMYLSEFKSADNTVTAYAQLTAVHDKELLKQAVLMCVQASEALNMIFNSDEYSGQPYQYLRSENVDINDIFFEVETNDLSGFLRQESERPLPVSEGKCCRVLLVSNKETYLVISINHLVADEHSFVIFLRQIFDCYDKLSNGENISSGMKNAYRRYLVEKSEDDGKYGVDYWNRVFADRSYLEPFHMERLEGDTSSSDGETIEFEVDNHLISELKKICAEHDTTLFTGLLAVLAVFITRQTHRNKILLITPATDRVKYLAEDTIGMYLDDMLIPADIDANAAFADILAAVKDSYLNAYKAGNTAMQKSLEKSGLYHKYFKERLKYVFLDFVETDHSPVCGKNICATPLVYYYNETQAERNIAFFIHHVDGKYFFALGYKYRCINRESSGKFIHEFIDTLEECVLSGEDDNSPNESIADVREIVRSVWNELLECSDIDGDTNFFDAGGYSMLLYSLAPALTDRLGYKFPFVKLMEYPTINSFSDYILNARKDTQNDV